MSEVVRLPRSRFETALRAIDALLAERARYRCQQWIEMADELQFRIDEMFADPNRSRLPLFKL